MMRIKVKTRAVQYQYMRVKCRSERNIDVYERVCFYVVDVNVL
jgi:hypothetical protein